MNVKITLTFDERAIQNVAGDHSKRAVLRAAQVSRERARNNLRQSNRFHTGELDSTLTYLDVTTDPLHPIFAVGSPVKQAVFNEFGTKAHGPVRAKKLRFKPKGAAGFVFAKWVRGIKPVRFMKKALDSLTVYDYLD